MLLEIENKKEIFVLWITRLMLLKKLGVHLNWFLECQKIILLLTEKFYPIAY